LRSYMTTLASSLTDETTVVIYDHNIFIIKATGVNITDIYGTKVQQLLCK
jgi:hypothetical protein